MGLKFRRIASVCLTAVMGTSLAASSALALSNDRGLMSESTQNINFENVTGKMDLSSIVLQNLSPSVLENAGLSSSQISANADYTVIVELEEECVLDKTGSAAAASEYITTYAGKRTLSNIKNSQQNYLNSLTSAGIKYTLKRSYTTVTNALAITVNYSDLKKLASFNGVKSVVLSSSYAYPEAITVQDTAVADNSSSTVYATGIYDSQAIIDEYGVDGSGVAVAILDTGLDYTHEAFLKEPSTVRYEKSDIANIISSKRSAGVSTLDGGAIAQSGSGAITADDVYINAKVPFAYDYADHDTDVYPSYSNHGTHVAGIVAGQSDSYTDKDGIPVTTVNGAGQEVNVPFKGVAYNAQLVICKVFTDDYDSENLGGAISEDIVAALDDCVNLGVDVINMSLGTAAGFSSISISNADKGLNDTEGEMLNRIYGKIRDAGISLICAASNEYSSGYGSAFGTNLASNPDSGTIGSPSTFDGAMSVASINGQLARYLTVIDSNNVEQAIYYLDSSDENSLPYDFLNEMLSESEVSKRFKYVIINGRGEAADYTDLIKRELSDKTDGPVIAVITRGKTTFQEKIQLAMEMGADAVLMANNVAGTIRMSLGDLKEPVPSVSVTLDAGNILRGAANSNGVGYLTVNRNYQAGPFMNDYSSWGVTSDLKLKPEITAHGGEITSAVPGGYAEQSGTSMASPNFAGFVALLRSYLIQQNPSLRENPLQLNRLINQITMSSASIVYDQNILPYSPRKQGAGLATLANAFSTKAYLYTVEGEDYNGIGTDNRDYKPKVELGEDKDKEGVYSVNFYATNFGTGSLSFTLDYLFMTESLSSDGLSVAEKAYLFSSDEHSISWTVAGAAKNTGDTIEIPAGGTVKVTATLTLTDKGKKYLDDTFINGMFVEGYIILKSTNASQCDLSLPYLGFYGDWSAAPMLDYDCYEIAQFQQDTSLTDDERPQAQVWATQAFAEYNNGKMSVPMGGYIYTQDPTADQIYTDPEHASISCYDMYYGENEASNYLTAYSIRALYAGLLRNAEVVQYIVYDDVTGEVIKTGYDYRVSKAYAGGGSAVPANVELKLDPQELGLLNNGKYRIDFSFFFRAEDVGQEGKLNDDNTFSMIFYVDYEAPVLVDARVRYYDYKDGNKDKQRIYLDLDVFDNHYAQNVILCYIGADQKLQLATQYITPVYNANKNGVTTVSIEITDLYDKYSNSLYIQIDDYALNHSIYRLALANRYSAELPSDFDFVDGEQVTIGVNESYKLNLNYEGEANISDFTWESSNSRVLVKNGEIFGVSEGTARITVGNGKGVYKSINVTVTDKGITLGLPSISFGLIETSDQGIRNAQGSVNVNAGRTYELEIITDPWYYPVELLNVNWKSSDPTIATVAEKGNGVGTGKATVTTLNDKGAAAIRAVLLDSNGNETFYANSVVFNVQDPFTISNYALTDYNGEGGYVKIPDNKNIMAIGEEAFKDDTTVEVVVIPATVTEIRARAFQGCTNLKRVYFISETPDDPEELAEIIPAAQLSKILANAFDGCTSLEFIDFTNVKVTTVDSNAFLGCTSLKTVKKMTAIGTMNRFAFYGCSSLEEVDLTGLHSAAQYVFADCTSLTSIKTDKYTAIGSHMFEGCTSLQSVEINTSKVGEYAFSGCTSLRTVTFGVDNISLGDRAFANTRITEITLPAGEVKLGDQVFGTGSITINVGANRSKDSYGAVYEGTTLLLAPSVIPQGFEIDADTTAIAAYAFSGSRFAAGISTITVPSKVTEIGEGAFAHLLMTGVTLPDGIEYLPDYAFYGCTALTSVTLPADLISVGTAAFEGCTHLAEIGFNNKLVEIGGYAFANCAVTSVTLPDSVKAMGDSVFAGCSSLTEAHLPALETLGSYTFGMTSVGGQVSACNELTTVTFADGAKTIGEYTFFPGSVYNGNEILYLASKLTSVTLPSGITEIGEGAFYYCNSLTSINLRNVTKVGDSAFANCVKLATVTGMSNLTDIGAYAFANCIAISSLSLDNAVNIGESAFDMSDNLSQLVSIKLSKAENIGNFAFYGGNESSVTLPSSLKTLGYAVFTNSSRLTSVSISGSDIFFSVDGVLYRNITNKLTGKTYTELCVYPAAKGGESYTVPEGTIMLSSYAFANLGGTLKSVTLPYTLKIIGSGAFYNSGIESYTFLSYNAPVLLSEEYSAYTSYYPYVDSLLNSPLLTLYYNNFETEFIQYSVMTSEAYRANSTLRLTYPVNGVGFDNYVYGTYFGATATGDEVMDDNTYEFKSAMDDLLAEYGDAIVETIKSWESWTVNEENKKFIEEFSETIKDAHRLYNNVKGETQFALLDEGKESGYYYNLLTAIESALKPVKERFGIVVKVSSLTLSEDSNYRTEYFVGEAFDKTGLVIIVTFDDYSTAIIGADDVTVVSDYADSLTELDKYVTVEYEGAQLRLPITVVEKEGSGCNSTSVILGCVGGFVGLLLVAGAVVLVIFLRKRKNGKGPEAKEETGVSNSEPEVKEETKPEEKEQEAEAKAPEEIKEEKDEKKDEDEN